MSANLFALNNLIAANLVTYTREEPHYNTVYTATPGNVLFAVDDEGFIKLDRIVNDGNWVIAYDTEGFDFVLDSEEPTVGAMDANGFNILYGDMTLNVA
jgi:hypothetical protein